MMKFICRYCQEEFEYEDQEDLVCRACRKKFMTPKARPLLFNVGWNT